MKRRNRVSFTEDEKEMLVLCTLESLRNGYNIKQGVSDYISTSRTKHSYASCYKKILELKKENQYKAYFDEFDGLPRYRSKNEAVVESKCNEPEVSVLADNTSNEIVKKEIMSTGQLSEWLNKFEIVVSNYTELTTRLEEVEKTNIILVSENEKLKKHIEDVTKDRDDILSVFVRARNLIADMPQQKDERVVTVDRNLIVQSIE